MFDLAQLCLCCANQHRKFLLTDALVFAMPPHTLSKLSRKGVGVGLLIRHSANHVQRLAARPCPLLSCALVPLGGRPL